MRQSPSPTCDLEFLAGKAPEEELRWKLPDELSSELVSGWQWHSRGEENGILTGSVPEPHHQASLVVEDAVAGWPGPSSSIATRRVPEHRTSCMDPCGRELEQGAERLHCVHGWVRQRDAGEPLSA